MKNLSSFLNTMGTGPYLPAQMAPKSRARLRFFYWALAISTLYLAAQGSLFTQNFSMLAGGIGRQGSLVFWGFLAGSFFLHSFCRLFTMSGYSGRAAYVFLYSASLLLSISTLIPYEPEIFPVWTHVHFLLAFFSPLLLFSGLACFFYSLLYRGMGGYLLLLCALTLAAFALYFSAGRVTGLLEVFIVLSLLGLLPGLFSHCPKGTGTV